ncbi:MAG: hypothetical protein LBI17_01455 [Rickettsiales bacterium]|jgi:hypothetical protein|nr:hypothetical protein [Rickettsiales bacterium]
MAVKKKAKKAAAPKRPAARRPAARSFASEAKSYLRQAERKVGGINVGKFLTDAVSIILNPVKYFSSVKADGKYEDMIVKVLIYGLIAAGLKILFNIGSIRFLDALASIVLMSVYGVVITFGLGGVMMFFSYLTKGEMNFETATKAVASCIFMYPLAWAAYNLAFTYWILFFFSLTIDLYIVFLIYTATTHCLKGEHGISRIIFGIFAAFVVILHFSSAGAFYVANKNPMLGFEHNLVRYQKGRLPL